MLSIFFKKKPKPVLSLKDYMERNKISRAELAAYLGISEAYLSYYLNGKRTFGGKTALRISKKTGVAFEKLIGESN